LENAKDLSYDVVVVVVDDDDDDDTMLRNPTRNTKLYTIYNSTQMYTHRNNRAFPVIKMFRNG
jgi:sulfur relay (sulfurtransferase) DsrF/TusC family protein